MSTNGFWRELDDQKEVKQEKEVEEKVETKPKKSKEVIPSEFKLAVKLSSAGKLSCPETIHVRDYLIDDILRISKDTTNILESMLDVLDSMVYEDIDPYLLHERELEELMLNVYANYWSPIVRDYDYRFMALEEDLDAMKEYFTERLAMDGSLEFEEIEKKAEEKVEQFRNGDYEQNVDIVLSDLKTKVIKKDFKEPIVLKDKSGKELLAVRLQRIGDPIIAKQFVEKQMAYEEQKFAEFDEEKATVEEREEFINYVETKEIMLAKTLSALRLIRVNGKELNAIEEKLESFNEKVFFSQWSAVNRMIEEKQLEEFGIDPVVELKSPFTGKPVKRRCHFRLLELIPADQQSESSEYDIGFGD